jgi:hypothetical protein
MGNKPGLGLDAVTLTAGILIKAVPGSGCARLRSPDDDLITSKLQLYSSSARDTFTEIRIGSFQANRAPDMRIAHRRLEIYSHTS